MHRLSQEEFEEAVGDALDSIPPALHRGRWTTSSSSSSRNRPPATPICSESTKGLPLTERGDWWAAGALPDRITIFQGPLDRMCESGDELRDEIAVTVVHEVAHHFGINDARLHELGWG